MVRKSCLTVIIISLFNVLMFSLAPWGGGAEERIYPHWTGKHCTECHVEEKIPELRFGGDTVQICSRCHQAAAPCTEMHISTFAQADAEGTEIPPDWPRRDARITCLTCHAAPLQMYADAAGVKGKNPYFLRSGAQGTEIYRFCFNCHRELAFQKINPHEGIPGAEGQSFCFRCHTVGLNTGFETCFEASLKTKRSALCTGCHWQVTTNGHTVHNNLTSDMLEADQDALRTLEQEGLELPLADGSMHCATCHNPHPPGIIGRREAAIGAGEKFFLRIPESRVLCGICHGDKPLDDYMERFKHR